MRRVVAGLGSLALLASVFTAGCTRSTERQGKVLRVAIESRAGSFDPRQSVDAASGRISELVFSRLVKYDSRLQIVPDLAERWDIEQDGRLYRFHLRPGVRFHDGTPLDATDVAYTFQSLLDPKTASPKRQTYEFIDHIVVVDPQTIEFYLKQPNAPFLTNMILGILPSEVATDPGKAQPVPVGSGPFQMIENDNGGLVRLKAFDGYFEGRPQLDGIVFRHIAEATMRVLELEKGSIDFIQNDIIPEFIPALRRDEHVKVLVAPGINCSYLGLNLKDPILAKQPVRQAIAHAIDRETIQALVLRDTATLANAVIGPTVPGNSPEVKVPAYDPARARELLDQAGYPDPDGPGPAMRMSLVYKTSTDKVRLRIADTLRRNLEEVGIKMSLQSYEFATFFADVKKGNFQVFSLTWVGLADPDGLYNIFHSSAVPPNGSNRVFYANPQVDRLLEQGRVEVDPKRREAAYAEALRIVGEELPLIPLWYTNNVAAMRDDVEGFELYPLGNYYSLAKVHFKPKPEVLAEQR